MYDSIRLDDNGYWFFFFLKNDLIIIRIEFKQVTNIEVQDKLTNLKTLFIYRKTSFGKHTSTF